MRTRTLLVLTTTAALTLTACSGDDPAPSEPTGEEAPTEEAAPGGSVTFAGTDGVAWEQSDLSTGAGANDVTLTCGPEVPHGLAIEGVQGGEEFLACTGGQSVTATIELAAGDYTFFCTIPGHREAGMEGTLSVG